MGGTGRHATRGARGASSGRSSVRTRAAAAFLVALGAFALGACAGSGSKGPVLGAPVLVADGPKRPVRVETQFQPAFDALQAAIEDGEDDVARAILTGIYARRPSAELREFAEGFERVLDGRAVMRSLKLRLEIEPVEGSEEDLQLVLVAENDLPDELRVALPGGMLQRIRVALDAVGNEGRNLTMERVDVLADLVLPPGQETRASVGSYDVPVGGALAVRERFVLEVRSGTVSVGDEELPAKDPVVAAADHQRVAPYLPDGPVEPAELARYLQAGRVFLPALLERAVRIDPARTEEALDLLTPAVERLSVEDPDRVVIAVPALRWLARETSLGGEPEAWARWFAARAEAPSDAGREPVPALDLPGGE